MGRLYPTRIVVSNGVERYHALVSRPGFEEVEIEVSPAVFEAINDLQREHWRLERRESRHTLHVESIEAIPHCEDALFEQDEEGDAVLAIIRGLASLPPIQRRRLVGRTLGGKSIAELARLEGCSERAIKYSIAAARKNLRKYLEKSGGGCFTL